jgi:hypothetical protein
MLDQRTGETHLINCMESLDNIYGNGFQTYHLKGKAYREGEFRELVHFIAIEYASEQEIICGSKPAGEKRGEGKIASEQQPP